jgi:hypothetical protein
MSALAAAAIIAGGAALGKIIGSSIGNRQRKNELRDAKIERDKQIKKFEKIQFSNPFAGMGRPSASLQDPTTNFQDFTSGMQNQFVGAQNFASQMQNTAEDLTVDTTAAEFMAQQQQQGLADTLGGLKGAAGGGGVAALAQSIAGQQSQNLQAARASIATQEQANRQLSAEQAGQIQQMTAQESSANQQRRMEGAASIQELQARSRTGQQEFVAGLAQQRGLQGAQLDLSATQMEGQGEQFRQEMDFNRRSTILGGANLREGSANQSITASRTAMMGGVGDLIGAGAQYGASKIG